MLTKFINNNYFNKCKSSLSILSILEDQAQTDLDQVTDTINTEILELIRIILVDLETIFYSKARRLSTHLHQERKPNKLLEAQWSLMASNQALEHMEILALNKASMEIENPKILPTH